MERLVDRKTGFTLLEMIAVMAIIGILAATLAPNALRSIDRAAARAEAAALQDIAASLETYLIETKTLPTTSNWHAQLAHYTDRGSAALQKNSRQQTRTLILDTSSSPAPRAIFLSSMRVGLAAPPASSINTATKFQTLWDTPEHALPDASTWSGWSKWRAVEGSEDSLLIQRVNLRPIYADQLKTANIVLNNPNAATHSYRLYDASGSLVSSAAISPTSVVSLSSLARGDRIDFYSGASYSGLVYSYIVQGDDKSFDLSEWIDGS